MTTYVTEEINWYMPCTHLALLCWYQFAWMSKYRETWSPSTTSDSTGSNHSLGCWANLFSLYLVRPNQSQLVWLNAIEC